MKEDQERSSLTNERTVTHAAFSRSIKSAPLATSQIVPLFVVIEASANIIRGYPRQEAPKREKKKWLSQMHSDVGLERF